MTRLDYKAQNVCSSRIVICIENDIIDSVQFIGGCPGSLRGVSSLVQGLGINSAIQKLKGIKCGAKTTSCPDQLAAALTQFIKEKGSDKNGNKTSNN